MNFIPIETNERQVSNKLLLMSILPLHIPAFFALMSDLLSEPNCMLKTNWSHPKY